LPARYPRHWSGQAAADISKWESQEELGKIKIERHYTAEELEEDMAFAESGL
jgi:hypothetical protein